MKISLTNQSQSKTLLLIFSGWACDERLFTELNVPDFSVMVISDYTDFSINELKGKLLPYTEICVLAWSYGVPHAAEFLATHRHNLPVTLSIAINGTTTPVDDSYGIPSGIFNGTLETLSQLSLKKFYRRICHSAQTFDALPYNADNADINALAGELKAIGNRRFPNADKWTWDYAFISQNDKIIPPANQANAWNDKKNAVTIETRNWSHLPDFQSIASRLLINKHLVASRFRNATNSYSTNALVQRQMADTLAHKLIEGGQGMSNISLLEFGAGNGNFTSLYYPALASKISTLYLIDIAGIDDSLPGHHITADAELKIRQLPDNSCDIICGAATIQWFNSPFSFIRECKRVLKPGGKLIFSTFSNKNFPEISDFAPSLPLSSEELWMKELSSLDFHTQIQTETEAIHFKTSKELLEHLRLTGVNSIQSDDKIRFRAVKRILREGIRTLTYAPLYIAASKL